MIAERPPERVQASSGQRRGPGQSNSDRTELTDLVLPTLTVAKLRKRSVEEEIRSGSRVAGTADQGKPPKARMTSEIVELHVHVDLAIDIDVVAPCGKRPFGQMVGGQGERTCRVDDDVDTVQSAHHVLAMLEPEHEVLQTELERELAHGATVSSGEDHSVPRCSTWIGHADGLGFGGDQATGVAGGSVEQNRLAHRSRSSQGVNGCARVPRSRGSE